MTVVLKSTIYYHFHRQRWDHKASGGPATICRWLYRDIFYENCTTYFTFFQVLILLVSLQSKGEFLKSVDQKKWSQENWYPCISTFSFLISMWLEFSATDYDTHSGLDDKFLVSVKLSFLAQCFNVLVVHNRASESMLM